MKSISILLFVLLIANKSLAQGADIIGPTTPEQIRSEHRVFDIYVDRYNPDSTAIEFLSAVGDSISIKILFGTWCHDSKREIPAFMKVMEVVDNQVFSVEYIGVSRDKTDPDGYYNLLGLKYTPTFIIYKDSFEVGRIVEESAKSIEEDLAQILQSGS